MERRVPVQHFFDGFRTSHEVNKVKLVDYKTMKAHMRSCIKLHVLLHVRLCVRTSSTGMPSRSTTTLP